MPHLLVLAGPSAVGKTTVMEHILRMRPSFTSIRSMTTRPRRSEGEDEYLHVDADAFALAVKRGELLEHTVYGSYCYGTPHSEIVRAQTAEKIPLLILELTGVHSVKKGPYAQSTVAVYLYDDLAVMEARLYERALANHLSKEALAVFGRRRDANRRDYLSMPSHAAIFDLFIRNRNPEDTARSILMAFDSVVEGYAAMHEEEKAAIALSLVCEARKKKITVHDFAR